MRNGILQYVWRKWELLFRVVGGVRPIHPGESYLFFISTRRYFGKPFVVEDVKVRRFDKIIELHMNNELLFRLLRETKSVVGIGSKLLREVHRTLPALAKSNVLHEAHDARVLMGTTFINRGVTQFGFETFPLRNRGFRMLTTWYLRKVFGVVNPHAEQLLQSHGEVFVPKVVAITKEKFIRLYGDDSPNRKQCPTQPEQSTT